MKEGISMASSKTVTEGHCHGREKVQFFKLVYLEKSVICKC